MYAKLPLVANPGHSHVYVYVLHRVFVLFERLMLVVPSRFTLAGVGQVVDVCFRSQGCRLKVVHVNIQARDSYALSTLRVISISKITTYNNWTNFAAHSLCAGLRRVVSRSVQCKTSQLSMRQCFFLPSTRYH